MEILESLEVRWFLPPGASVGAMLENWFGPTQDEGKRIDHYLRTGRSDLNLKARLEEGKPAKVELGRRVQRGRPPSGGWSSSRLARYLASKAAMASAEF